MNFGVALRMIKEGKKVKRDKWSEGTWLTLESIYTHTFIQVQGENSNLLPLILVHKKDRKLCCWIPSHEDLLSEDWKKA